MKRAHDATTPTTHESKKHPKETQCPVPILGLCIAAAKALVPANESTPWSRAIHIPRSPLADPSLLVDIYAVLTRRVDLEIEGKREPVIRNLVDEFPLSRRVVAAIHCYWVVRGMLRHTDQPVCVQPPSVRFVELRKWLSTREIDHLLIHASATNLWATDTQELLLQTPSIFARHLETMQIPDPFAYEVAYLISTATKYIVEYPELTESAVLPNIRVIFTVYAARTPQRISFDLHWLLRTVKLLPLIQAVWPLVDLNRCPSPIFTTALMYTPRETVNWVVENMPRATKQQFLARQRAMIRLERFNFDALDDTSMGANPAD